MLNKAKTLKGYKLNTRDGDEIGKVKDFYFDDNYWTTRYLIADTGGWLTGRQVLISPYSLLEVNHDNKLINVSLTKKQIEDSPSLKTDLPVSKQYEESYYGYYGYPTYWDGEYAWGGSPYIVRDPAMWKAFTRGTKSWDPHLRSVHEVTGNHIEATDGTVGHVDDFLLDDDTRAIRYLIVDTHNFWPGGKNVLISPRWIDRVTWPEKKIFVDVSKATIKGAPEYLEPSFITRDYETKLYKHYDRHGYWTNEPDLRKAS